MKKSLACFTLLLSLVVFLFGGCSEKDSSPGLVGTWYLELGETDVESITFYSDGTCLVDNEEMGEWSIVDDTLKILGPYGGKFWNHDNIVGEYIIYQSDSLIMRDALIDGDYTDTLQFIRGA